MIPWKLILLVALAVLLALFIGFNLDNKCEISFVFGRVQAVPVYLTILISFVAGLAAALPFSFRRRAAKAGKKKAIAAGGAPLSGEAAAADAPSRASEADPKADPADAADADGKKKNHAGAKKQR